MTLRPSPVIIRFAGATPAVGSPEESWLGLCNTRDEMPEKPTPSDRQPGRLPEVRETDAGVTFVFEFDDANTDRRQLLLRCDAGGNVWVSIVPPADSALPDQPR